MTSAADALVDRMARLIWTVLLDAGRGDLADQVSDRLAGMAGVDLRLRAVRALRAVLADVITAADAEDLLRRGIIRDEISMLDIGDRDLIQRVRATRDVDAAGRRRARRVVADLLERVTQVLRAAHCATEGLQP